MILTFDQKLQLVCNQSFQKQMENNYQIAYSKGYRFVLRLN